MVAVQTDRTTPQLQSHRAIAIVHRHAGINPASEQSGKKNETFRGGHEAKRLIHVGAGGRRQMRQCDPYEHKPAHRVEFQTASHRSATLDTRGWSRVSDSENNSANNLDLE